MVFFEGNQKRHDKAGQQIVAPGSLWRPFFQRKATLDRKQSWLLHRKRVLGTIQTSGSDSLTNLQSIGLPPAIMADAPFLHIVNDRTPDIDRY